MKRPPGRPPLDADSPSAAVCVKLPATDYDRAYLMATAEGITVPELLRNALEVELLVNSDSSVTATAAFRMIRSRRNEEQSAIYHDQLANMDVRHALRSRRLRAGFIETVRRSVVYERHLGICGICQRPVGKIRFHVDHIVPLARGGQHSYANTQPSHPRCNFTKGAR